MNENLSTLTYVQWDTTVSDTKTDKLTEVPPRVSIRDGPRNHVLDRGSDSSIGKSTFLGDGHTWACPDV